MAVPTGFTGSFAASAGSDTVTVETTVVGESGCLEAGVLQNGKLDVQRKDCANKPRAFYPVASTDGRTMLNSERNLAVDIPTGKITHLKVPDPVIAWPKPVFEDASHALVVTQSRADHKSGPQSLYRCDVTTGDCKLLRTEQDSNINLALP